ncbi:hypothetical protein OsJ_02525 [Oryza sativa Japonica Group]|uniref:Uncharacterized protein n=1 Tax=Oryza sativa subsp. japonica TaxID=39947 RepID=B9EXY9_ORYSJ|nr:hypothetical protein OsJ_02525 [Oryza sativa Japonica Group]
MSLVSSFMASLLVGGYAYIDKTDGAWMNLKTDRALRQRRAPIGGVAGGVAGGPGRVGGGAGVESGDGGGGDRGGRRGGGVLDGDGDDPCPRATSADASEPSEADSPAAAAAAAAASASSAGRFGAMRSRFWLGWVGKSGFRFPLRLRCAVQRLRLALLLSVSVRFFFLWEARRGGSGSSRELRVGVAGWGVRLASAKRGGGVAWWWVGGWGWTSVVAWMPALRAKSPGCSLE